MIDSRSVLIAVGVDVFLYILYAEDSQRMPKARSISGRIFVSLFNFYHSYASRLLINDHFIRWTWKRRREEEPCICFIIISDIWRCLQEAVFFREFYRYFVLHACLIGYHFSTAFASNCTNDVIFFLLHLSQIRIEPQREREREKSHWLTD